VVDYFGVVELYVRFYGIEAPELFRITDLDASPVA
jgi:hypothetical protein